MQGRGACADLIRTRLYHRMLILLHSLAKTNPTEGTIRSLYQIHAVEWRDDNGKAGPLSVERLEMDLPFVNILCVQTSTQQSAGPLTYQKHTVEWRAEWRDVDATPHLLGCPLAAAAPSPAGSWAFETEVAVGETGILLTLSLHRC